MLFSNDAYGKHSNTSLSHFPCFQIHSAVIISHSWWFSTKWTQMNFIIWFSRDSWCKIGHECRSCWDGHIIDFSLSLQVFFFNCHKKQNKYRIHKGFRGVVINAGSVWMCALALVFLCLRLALAWRGREDWSERSGLMSAGHWAHGSVASDCHH